MSRAGANVGIANADVLSALLDDLADRVAGKLVARLPHALPLLAQDGLAGGKAPKPASGEREGRDALRRNHEQRVLRPAAAAHKLGVSRATVYRWERSGAIPSRIQLGPHAVGWYERDLDEFLERRPLLR